MINPTIDLEIREKILAKIRDVGLKTAEATAKEFAYDKEDELSFKDSFIKINEMRFDKTEEAIQLDGDLVCAGEDLGYVNLSLRLDLDLVLDIIETYMKKMGKLKTVLEATK